MSPVDQNPKTRIVNRPTQEGTSQAFFRVAFSLISRRIAEEAIDKPSGVVVGAATPRNGAVDVLFVSPERNATEPLVFGRHECADVILKDDPSLSLRHALLLLTQGADGKPFIRVLDLRTPKGLLDMAGRYHASIAANRPVALRASESALFVLPTNPFLVECLQKNPFAVFDKVAWMDPVPWIPDVAVERHFAETSDKATTPSIVSVAPPPPIDAPGDASPKSASKRRGVIKIETDARSYHFTADKRTLRAGVLVGRSGRCDLGDDTEGMPDVISRVHALFLSIDEQIHVFDVGSTHGLALEDIPIKHAALADEQPSELKIDEAVRISWVPEPPG